MLKVVALNHAGESNYINAIFTHERSHNKALLTFFNKCLKLQI